MIINNSNGNIINSKSVCLHDDIVKNLSFERKNNILELLVKKDGFTDKTYTICFTGVLGFQMTACDFWGKSPHILDFEYVDDSNRKMLPYLHSIKNDPINPNCKLLHDKEYIETVLAFGSGDKLEVVCETIIIGE